MIRGRLASRGSLDGDLWPSVYRIIIYPEVIIKLNLTFSCLITD